MFFEIMDSLSDINPSIQSPNNSEENRTWAKQKSCYSLKQVVNIHLKVQTLFQQVTVYVITLCTMAEEYNTRAQTQSFEPRPVNQIKRKWESLVLYFQDEFRRRQSTGETEFAPNSIYDKLYPVLIHNPMVIPSYSYSSFTRSFKEYQIKYFYLE